MLPVYQRWHHKVTSSSRGLSGNTTPVAIQWQLCLILSPSTFVLSKASIGICHVRSYAVTHDYTLTTVVCVAQSSAGTFQSEGQKVIELFKEPSANISVYTAWKETIFSQWHLRSDSSYIYQPANHLPWKWTDHFSDIDWKQLLGINSVKTTGLIDHM